MFFFLFLFFVVVVVAQFVSFFFFEKTSITGRRRVGIAKKIRAFQNKLDRSLEICLFQFF